MGFKKCCVPKCKSSSIRNEDKGVTYHKFPKDSELWDKWASATHYAAPKSPPSLVCSRHFCKDDFKKNKDSKYILKSDAIPSIFSWDKDTLNMEDPQTTESEVEPENKNGTGREETPASTSKSRKGSEAENLEAIKSFIEAQDVTIQANTTQTNEKKEKCNINLEKILGSPSKTSNPTVVEKPVKNVDDSYYKLEDTTQNENNPCDKTKPNNADQSVNIEEDTMAVASSVMEMILNETEANAMKNKAEKDNKQTIGPGSNMPLSVGSKVEAKDFSEDWYPAQIVEVDCDEMEVLVHYDNTLKKSDEWINVSSPRLRPFTGAAPPKEETKTLQSQDDIKEAPKDIKLEDKSKVYEVGERCLARWRDNRRFVATIQKDLGDGKFEVIFDDGVHWTCSITRLSKLKESRDVLTIDTTVQPLSGTASPVQQGGPSSESPSLVPTYSTHLFDPTRDYLGSKSERREKKRKLNIKEIFNIGQKKPKIPKIEKEKVVKEKKADVKSVKQKVPKTPSMKVKTIPDAVASIIGTITKDEIKMEMKSPKLEPMDVDDFDIYQQGDSQEANDSDPVDDEDKLERFDKPDHMHEEVIDKIREAIIKLECGLKESASVDQKEHALKLEVTTPKRETDSLKPKLKVIDSPVSAVGKPDTPIPVMDASQPEAHTLVAGNNTLNPDIKTRDSIINTPISDNDNEVLQSTNETIEDASSAEIEDQNSGMDSPRLDLEVSEADFNVPLPDSDATVSDIEMGNESPRIDIDSQNIPILVDIDAPLDNDPSESQSEDKSVVVVPQPQELKEPSRKLKKKLKKAKKLKVLDDETVQAEVERVKSELAAIKLKVDDMKAKMRRKKQIQYGVPLPESCLLPGEWACRWVNGQPVGKVSEMLSDGKPDASGKPALPRRSVEVQDKRLPPGWTKHMVRRSVGNSAGKWDVVLISPANKRFHTKTDMRNFLENADETTKSFEHALLDFGVHLKLARKLGWIASTPDGIAEAPETILPPGSFSATSPLVKKKNLSLKRRGVKLKDKKRPIKLKLQRGLNTYASKLVDTEAPCEEPEASMPALEDGYIWVGSLKVQVIDNLLRCPADECFKNFRNNTLLKMHIKHYHRDLCVMLGATPKVLDLAAARTKPTQQARVDPKIIKVKINKPQKREEYTARLDTLEPQEQITPTKPQERKIPRSQDSPKLRNALNKPVKRPKVLLPVRRLDPDDMPELPESMQDDDFDDIETLADAPEVDVCDFETAISTHTVTKPADKRKGNKKQKSFASFSKTISEDEEWFAMNSDDVDTRSSFPRSGTPDSKSIDPNTVLSSDFNEDHSNDPANYTLTETGEKVKIVRMKREEIINCHCGIREEDGLMVQCELCLCWQHALCHNIQKEGDVPDKYTCSICLNPRRGRRSARFLHDQDRLFEGLLPGAKPCESLRRSHELSGNLLRIEDALHALRVKYFVATKKDHPKLYLWAKDWEQNEMTYKLNSDYSDLNIMINGGIDKENQPLKPDEPNLLDIRTPSSEEHEDRYSQREGSVGSQALLSGLLSSPSAASLELPISTSELERLAKTVQEAAAEWQGQTTAPQPEAAIDNDVCRERLLKHIQRCQALVDSRLDSIEAQVAELESQEPSFGEHYETAEHYPRIKQTVQMLMRDLETMEELGVIT